MKEIIWSGASPVLMPREDPGSKIVFFVLLFPLRVALSTSEARGGGSGDAES